MSKENLSLEEYQELYIKFTDYYENVHKENQKRIRVGVWVNIIAPIIFLVISFISQSSKLVWLVLWVVSLFGIAFYLMYVEYMDFEMVKRMKEYGLDMGNGDSLMMESYSKEIARASERVQAAEQRHENALEKRELVKGEINELKAGLKEEVKKEVKKKFDKKEDEDEDDL